MATHKADVKLNGKNGKQSAVKMWEYLVTPLPTSDDNHEMEAVLNQLGAQGWELAAALGVGNKVRAVLKRRQRTATQVLAAGERPE